MTELHMKRLDKYVMDFPALLEVVPDEVLASPRRSVVPLLHALIRALLAGQELALTTPGQKGVQILEAHDAALIPFRATFLMHANDGVFPKLPAPGGLFAEEERAALHAAGLPIETFETAWQRETALYNAVANGERVTITYRTTDPKGTPLLPSLLVPPHDESAELPRSAHLAIGRSMEYIGLAFNLCFYRDLWVCSSRARAVARGPGRMDVSARTKRCADFRGA